MSMIIMRGLPGSGKTSWAKSWVMERVIHNQEAVRVSRDDLREALFGPSLVLNGVVADEDYISRVEQEQIRHHLRNGRSVVIDNLNLRDRYVRQYAAIACAVGVKWEVHDLRHVDVLACINRDASRGRNGGRLVGREVIEDLHKRFIAGKDLSKIPTPATLPAPIVQNPELPDAYVFDVDGTLADNSHRNPFDESAIPGDAVHENVKRVLMDFHLLRYHSPHDFPRIIIATARWSEKIELTKTWLRENAIEYDMLFHRLYEEKGVEDSRVKMRMLREITKDYYVRGWFDDRPRVSRALRAAGIQVFQVGNPDVEF